MPAPDEHRQRMATMYFEKHGKHPVAPQECAEAAREYWAEVHTRQANAAIHRKMEEAGDMSDKQRKIAEKDLMSDFAKALVR